MNSNDDDKKLDWMYKGANSLVDREEYLLGRSVDKALEQLNAEEKEKKLGLVPPKNHVEHECIPPSIRDFNKIVQAEQVDISAKLQEDPLVAIKKREEEARRQFLQNPVQLKKLQEALKAQQLKKQKKRHKKSKTSGSDSDLDDKIAKKLKYLKQDPSAIGISKKSKKKSKESILDTILMHKFNELKDKLSQDDLNDILAGNVSDSDKETKKKKKRKKKENSTSDESGSDSDSEGSIRGEKRRGRLNNKAISKKLRERSSSGDNGKEKERLDKYRNNTDKRRMKSRDHKVEDRRSRRSRSIDSDHYKYRESHNKYREKTKSTLRSERKTRATSSGDDKETERKERSAKMDNENDLEAKILKKLRMLRNLTESKENSDIRVDNSKKQTEKVHNKSSPQRKSGSTSSESSSEDSSSDKPSPKPHRYYDSDSDAESRKPKAFGLVKSDGTKLSLNKTPQELKKPNKSVTKEESAIKPDRKIVKKLSEEEKEKLRREMMKNAEKRDKERSENLRRYREEDKKEERESSNYDKDFLRKELLKTTKDATVETRIKSNLNNIQRSSKHMDAHFSRRK